MKRYLTEEDIVRRNAARARMFRRAAEIEMEWRKRLLDVGAIALILAIVLLAILLVK